MVSEVIAVLVMCWIKSEMAVLVLMMHKESSKLAADVEMVRARR